MEQDSDVNIPTSDAEVSCNTPTTGFYEGDFCLELAPPLFSYIQDDLSYMKRPIQPYDKNTSLKHFHIPEGVRGMSAARGGHHARPTSRPGMLTMVDQLAQQHRAVYSMLSRPRSRSRSRSPSSVLSGEEAIELAHYPDAKVPDPSAPAAIERDDFPAPQYAYSDPERRHRLSGRSDEVDGDHVEPVEVADDPKLQREEEELAKISRGLGGVFLQDVQARRQQRRRRLTAPDPRSTSRTASADREPRHGLRYRDPVHASPSRFVHSRSIEEELFYLRYHGIIPVGGWSGRAAATLPAAYNRGSSMPADIGGCTRTLPVWGRYGGGAVSVSPLTSDGRDGGFSSILHRQVDGTQSEDSVGWLCDGERVTVGRRGSSCWQPACLQFSAQPAPPQTDPRSPYYRRSRQVALYSGTVNPDSRYPVERLRLDRNRRLPDDVDKTQLERHLSEKDFVATFGMSRSEFYEQPEWRRNKQKISAHLY